MSAEVKPLPAVRPGKAFLSTAVRWRYADAAVLGAVVLLVTTLNQVWVALDRRPPHWDQARHLLFSLQYEDAFGSGLHWLTDYHTYPPLVYWVADLFYAGLGTRDAWAATLSQAVFLAVLTFSTYGLGRRLWSRTVGMVAALYVVTSPMIVSQFKDFMLDAPLTAMTALALYLLVRTDFFADRPASILLGLAGGLGLMTKWNFGLYLALPVAYAVLRAVVRAPASQVRQRIVNVVLAAVVAFAVAAPWYIPNFSQFRADTFGGGQSNAASIYGIPPVVSIESFLWYFWDLVSNQLYIIPFALFVVGVAFMFRSRIARTTNLLPALTIVSSYLAATALVNKDDRYTLPMLPAVAVLATYWLDLVRPRTRAWVAGGIVAYGCLTFAATSFGAGFLPRDLFVHLGKRCPTYPYFVGHCPGPRLVSGTFTYRPSGHEFTFRGIRIWSQNGFIDAAPSGDRWHQEDAFRTAARLSPSRTLYLEGPPIDFIWFNFFADQYFAEKHGVTLVTTPEQADVAAIWNEPGAAKPAPAGFRPLNGYPLPNRGTLRLYARHSIATSSAPTTVHQTPGPIGLSAAGLGSMSATLGRPIYWAGPRAGYTYELTQTPSGDTDLRYLPPGVAVGDARSDLLIVVTYKLRNAYAALRHAIATEPGQAYVLPRGGRVWVSNSYPRSAHVAFPGVGYQVEVYDRSPAKALATARSGQVRPVPRP
jgi:hypothetical protein